jgi:hypothetical protein
VTREQVVFALTKLRLLAVRASGLRKVPADIQALAELRRLDVSRNRDLDICDTIAWGDMTSLRSLDLSECRHLKVREHPRTCTHGRAPGALRGVAGFLRKGARFRRNCGRSI